MRAQNSADCENDLLFFCFGTAIQEHMPWMILSAVRQGRQNLHDRAEHSIPVPEASVRPPDVWQKLQTGQHSHCSLLPETVL